MKKRNAMFIALAAVLIFGIGVPLAYHNSSTLMGAFPATGGSSVSVTTTATPAGTSVGTTTIYVKAGAAAGGTGTIISPYNSLARAQAALEADSSIRVVHFNGTFNGTLDLNSILTKDLALMTYGQSSLVSPRFVIRQTTGVLENLTIHGFHIEGSMELAPAKTLSLTSLDFDGNIARSNAVWLDATDTVTISDCSFTQIHTGIATNTRTSTAVGTINVTDSDFTEVEDGLELHYVDDVTIADSSFDYTSNGIVSSGVTNLSVYRNTFLGEDRSYGVYIFQNPPLVVTDFDFQNNFVMENYAGVYNGSTSRTDSTISNNSFYGNDFAISLLGSGSNVYENNIIYSGASQYAFTGTTPTVYSTSDYNLFYGPVFNGYPYQLSVWQGETGEDMNSLEGDPLFVSATDLHISAGSPAIDAGTTTAVTDDIDGEARSGSYDIGADEY